MLKLIPTWAWAYVVAALVILAGIATLQANHARTELANLKAELATATQKADREQRDKEQALQTQADRVAHDDQTRNTQRLTTAADLDFAALSLRGAIDSANARAAREATDVATLIADATIAREILGQCSERYSVVAKAADQLSDQVTGLLDFIETATESPNK